MKGGGVGVIGDIVGGALGAAIGGYPFVPIGIGGGGLFGAPAEATLGQ